MCQIAALLQAMSCLSRLSADTVKPKPPRASGWASCLMTRGGRRKIVSAWSKKQCSASPGTTPQKLLDMKYLKNNNPTCKATYKRTMNSVILYTKCAKFYVHIKIEVICFRTGLILCEISSQWVPPPPAWEVKGITSPGTSTPKTSQCYHLTADFHPSTGFKGRPLRVPVLHRQK